MRKTFQGKGVFQIHTIEEARYDVAFVNSLWPISCFVSNPVCNRKSRKKSHTCNPIIDNQIKTSYTACHERTVVVPCAKFWRDRFHREKNEISIGFELQWETLRETGPWSLLPTFAVIHIEEYLVISGCVLFCCLTVSIIIITVIISIIMNHSNYWAKNGGCGAMKLDQHCFI